MGKNNRNRRKPNRRTQNRKRVTIETKLETKLEAKPETKFEAKPETNFETKPETKAEAKAVSKSKAKLNLGVLLKEFKSARKSKTLDIIVGMVFVAIIFGFALLNLIVPDKDFSEQENRSLQTFPKFSLSQYVDGRFESKLEDYANDQFVFRNGFIKFKTAVDLSVGVVYENGVWKSEDGYLIEDTMVPATGLIEADAAALKNFKDKHPGMNMYFMLAPTAVNILNDKLPVLSNEADQNKYMDRMFRYTAEYGYNNIDVRESFKKAAEDTQLYYRTDHHWTTAGAYLAFKDIAAAMQITGVGEFELLSVKNDFVGTLASKSGYTARRADSIELASLKDSAANKNSVIYYTDTKEKTSKFYKLKNLNKKDAYTVFGGSNHPYYTIKTPVEANRRLLLVKDSYANSMIPMLAQYFREIVVVDPRYYYGNIEDIIATEGINEVLFLYNANTFFGDGSMAMMLTDTTE